ncbi:MAG: LamG domain-containing protein [Phycisphaerales bacterium JB063]
MADPRLKLAPEDSFDERAFRQQVEAYLDGSLSEEDCSAMDSAMRRDAALRRVFVEICLQDQISHRLLAPSPDVVLLAADDAEAEDEVDGSASVMTSLIEEALRARRLQEVEERAQRELDASRFKEKQLEQRRALALQAERSSDARRAPAWVVWGSLAAALLLAVWIGTTLDESPTPRPLARGERPVMPANPLASASTVAYVSGSVDARWDSTLSSELTFKAGESVFLEAGLAQVKFRDGASVILEGPVKIEPTGPRALRLVSGRLSASSPEGAGGFRVDTPDMVVTNEYADFGVHVSPRAGTRAVALGGDITVDTRELAGASAGSLTHVRAGSSANALGGGVSVVRADMGEFVRSEEFGIREAAVDGDAYSRWLAYSYELRRDPGVLAYYTFEPRDDSSRRLPNRAVRTAGDFDGTLGQDNDAMTVPRWVEGRFPDKRALRFGIVDRMRAKTVLIEGFGGRSLGDTLTIAMWVKTPPGRSSSGGGTLVSLRDSPVRHMSFQFSLFLGSDPYPNRMQFGTGNELVVDSANDNFAYSGERSVSGDDWHLAVVVYEPTGTSFYMDGAFVSRASSMGPLAVTRPTTALRLGMDPYMPNFEGTSAVEAFMGDIDEFVILDRAMSREEITRMYQVGRPSQD